MRMVPVCAMVAAAWMASPSSASAAFVVSVSGSGSLVAPPADASPGAFESDTFSVWEESSGATSADLAVDFNGTPGSYQGNSDYSALGTTIAAGTQVSSTLIHLDPVSAAVGAVKATITFSNGIIGIALFGSSLDASDILGAPGTIYPTGTVPNAGLDTRGIDLRANDRFTVSADGKTLEVNFTANGAGFDQIRVLTSGVPEPASLAIWSLAGLGFGGGRWWRRRKLAIA